MSAADVLEVASRYLKRVKKSGPENIMAACPFHRKASGEEERNPSFTLSLTRGLFYCFSCHERGSFPKFLQAMGLSRTRISRDFSDILEGFERATPPPANPLRPQKAVAEPLPEGLLGLFDYCPEDLLAEGFEESVLRWFDVGFDEEHQRITYPLRDSEGRLVGISGRSIDGSYPRYKVYEHEYAAWGFAPRQTRKASLLWNCHNVLPECYFTREARLVVVEGFKACMWLHQCGIRNTVALLGSHMSHEQRWLIERTGSEVFVMLDNDEAGIKGRDQIARTLARGLKTRVVSYDADQPSDLAPSDLAAALEAAVPYHTWKIGQLDHKRRIRHVIWEEQEGT